MNISWTEAANETSAHLAGGQGVFHIGIGPVSFDKLSDEKTPSTFFLTHGALREMQRTLDTASPGGNVAPPQHSSISLSEGNRTTSHASYTEVRVTASRHGVEAIAEVLREIVDKPIVVRLGSFDSGAQQPNHPDLGAVTRAIYHEPARAQVA